MKKQMLFELELGSLNSKESLQKLEDLIAEGWLIKLATPLISFQATRSIMYVLEKEEETQKKLKAFEIITRKKVNVWDLLIFIERSNTDYEALTGYNTNRPSKYVLYKKEFDLLKEVLK